MFFTQFLFYLSFRSDVRNYPTLPYYITLHLLINYFFLSIDDIYGNQILRMMSKQHLLNELFTGYSIFPWNVTSEYICIMGHATRNKRDLWCHLHLSLDHVKTSDLYENHDQRLSFFKPKIDPWITQNGFLDHLIDSITSFSSITDNKYERSE